jgi:hypothetical protein
VVAPPETVVEPERVVGVTFDRSRVHWFDPSSGLRVAP